MNRLLRRHISAFRSPRASTQHAQGSDASRLARLTKRNAFIWFQNKEMVEKHHEQLKAAKRNLNAMYWVAGVLMVINVGYTLAIRSHFKDKELAIDMKENPHLYEH